MPKYTKVPKKIGKNTGGTAGTKRKKQAIPHGCKVPHRTDWRKPASNS